MILSVRLRRREHELIDAMPAPATRHQAVRDAILRRIEQPMIPPPDHPIRTKAVVIDDDDFNRLCVYAARAGIKPATLIREAIERWI